MAQQLGVDVLRLEDLLVGNALLVHGVAVVRHQHFLLADQGPLVAVRRAVVGIHHVGGGHAVGVRLHGVIGQHRQATHATLATVEAPGLADRQHLVEGLLHHQRGAGQLARCGHHVLVEEQGVVQVRRRQAFATVDEHQVTFALDQHVVATLEHGGVVGDHAHLLATVAGDVVPDHFLAALRNREGNAGGSALDAVTTGDQAGIGGVVARGVVDTLRRGGTAASGQHAQVIVRTLFQQLLVTRGQQGLVLAHVALVDAVQLLVGSVGVGMVHAGLVVGRWRGQTALPGRNGARGIAGTLAAQRHQILPEARGLGGVDAGMRRQADGSGQRQDCNSSQHSFLLAARSGAAVLIRTTRSGRACRLPVGEAWPSWRRVDPVVWAPHPAERRIFTRSVGT